MRVRGIQTHGKDVDKIHAGQRTAVNLGGIDKDEIERGMVLTEPNVFRSTQIVDTEIEVLETSKRALKSRQRVRVHLGTVEALARVEVLDVSREIAPGAKGFVQIRLEKSIVAVPGERFILRQYSPQITIAGGKILDALADKHSRKSFSEVNKYLSDLIKAEEVGDSAARLKLFLETEDGKGSNFQDLQARTGWKKKFLAAAVEKNAEKKAIIDCEGVYVARSPFDDLKSKIVEEIERFHAADPLAPGVLRETLREKTSSKIPLEVFKTVLNYLEKEDQILSTSDIVRSISHSNELTAEEEKVKKKLSDIYSESNLQVPTLKNAIGDSIIGSNLSEREARKVFQLIVNSESVVKVSEEFYFMREAIEDLIRKVKDYAEKDTEDRLIGVPEFKEISGVSRKYAIPLLEYLDGEKITKRAGNKRLVL